MDWFSILLALLGSLVIGASLGVMIVALLLMVLRVLYGLYEWVKLTNPWR